MADALDPTAVLHTRMPLCATLGIREVSAAADAVVLAVDFDPGLCTSNDLIHGGTIMALADSAGAYCAMLNLPEGAVGTSTIESKSNFIGAVRDGTVTATSSPLHRGGTTIVVETEVRDSAGKLVAKTTQTQTVLRPR
ncbi:MAG: hotdog fold thioesterase [Acidimicrobiia bacterium]|nr:hotdog fold thioesterase [Acidimicrobiia bacterium]